MTECEMCKFYSHNLQEKRELMKTTTSMDDWGQALDESRTLMIRRGEHRYLAHDMKSDY